jgi:hypothetical protein
MEPAGAVPPSTVNVTAFTSTWTEGNDTATPWHRAGLDDDFTWLGHVNFTLAAQRRNAGSKLVQISKAAHSRAGGGRSES